MPVKADRRGSGKARVASSRLMIVEYIGFTVRWYVISHPRGFCRLPYASGLVIKTVLAGSFAASRDQLFCPFYLFIAAKVHANGAVHKGKNPALASDQQPGAPVLLLTVIIGFISRLARTCNESASHVKPVRTPPPPSLTSISGGGRNTAHGERP